MEKKLTLENLPKEVVDTWKTWKNNFDESTTAKKVQSSENLQKHFAACEAAGLDRSQVAVILFKVK